MNTHTPQASVSNVVDFETIRRSRERDRGALRQARTGAMARRLLTAAIALDDIPFEAAYFAEDDAFVVSRDLSELELRVAAYACARRALTWPGDQSTGIDSATLRRLLRIFVRDGGRLLDRCIAGGPAGLRVGNTVA